MAKQILLVDDDSDIREVLSEVLRDEGYAVATAANGAEALKQLESARQTPPSLILLDLMMPVMDGHQFLDQYAADQTLPFVPVVVISANVADRGTPPRSDVLLYMRKPIDIDRLLTTLRRWCA